MTTTGKRLVELTPSGLYCEQGDFYVDPWRPVPRAVITHAHGDHARRGNGRYLTTFAGEKVLQTRMGSDAVIDCVEYGQQLDLNGVKLSLHPAGHVLGSAQIRIEFRGEVWVISGDYKIDPDLTCAAFEPVRCNTFISESTFGLPIYRWPAQQDVFADINEWWRRNKAEGRAAVIFGYAFGKAQRVLSGLDPSIGPIYCHGAVQRLNRDYRDSGIPLPETEYSGAATPKKDWAGAMIVAPPSAMGTPWLRKFGDVGTAFVSGWMLVRGTRRRRAVDRGFVLSDHADWPGLQTAIRATGAERVLVTHGQVPVMVKWLRESGLDAEPVQTQFEGEQEETPEDAALEAVEESAAQGGG
ncbi:ligase-associated DNA damage response exonuclease [Planctomicrobium piriforme]|uniref:Putative mRNA 3-end processing factor n=1 Tax=Planctomicrobium piriforme TaxID=1576369 RepID=A0A1I3LBZ3_9PLAN|nr:ligase-associated DNA damage response exonuclease [Planctomicrobium piriforme]SFI82283.1 putative mRNA 3-end processing factor [Planctomicrobium piriforme]